MKTPEPFLQTSRSVSVFFTHFFTMRDMVASCFSENAVSVSNLSCSNYANTACINRSLSPFIRNSVANHRRFRSIVDIPLGETSFWEWIACYKRGC